MKKILLIQTAFIGDVVLATSVVESIKLSHPDYVVDFLLRKGNESLLFNHPFLRKIIIWEKRKHKFKNLFALLLQVRKEKYDVVINLQRFLSSGILTAFSGSKQKFGFKPNPLSFLFTKSYPHILNGMHETERNLSLIQSFCSRTTVKPKLYPLVSDFDLINKYIEKPFITISPTSVWYTKQFPAEKWIEFIQRIPENIQVYLLGGKGDFEACNTIKNKCTRDVINLAGKLSFLQSAALMQKARMNFVNDSGPLHFASAVNAPVTAIFCSTSPVFGFGPLSDNARIIETKINLSCKPCGLHGKKSCPLGHFNCALTIEPNDLTQQVPQ